MTAYTAAEQLELLATKYDLMAATARNPEGNFATARREWAAEVRSIIPHIDNSVELYTNKFIIARLSGFEWATARNYFDMDVNFTIEQIDAMRAKLAA